MKHTNVCTRRLLFPNSPTPWSVSGGVLPVLEWTQWQEHMTKGLAILVKDLHTGKSFGPDWPTLGSEKWVLLLLLPTQRQGPMMKSLAIQLKDFHFGRSVCSDQPNLWPVRVRSPSISESTHRLYPMIDSLGYPSQGWYSDALNIFQRRCEKLLCDHGNLNHTYRHSASYFSHFLEPNYSRVDPERDVCDFSGVNPHVFEKRGRDSLFNFSLEDVTNLVMKLPTHKRDKSSEKTRPWFLALVGAKCDLMSLHKATGSWWLNSVTSVELNLAHLSSTNLVSEWLSEEKNTLPWCYSSDTKKDLCMSQKDTHM